MKFLGLLSFSLLVSASSAFAGNLGDVSCDPSWKICLQSYSTDMDSTLHFVGAIQTEKTSLNVPSTTPVNLIIENQSGNVVVRTAKDGSADIIVGTISEDISGDNVKAALSRGLNLSEGLSAAVTSKEGSKKTLCNVTALGFIYERYTYKTLDNTFVINKAGKAVYTLQTNERVEPAVSVHSSIIPCAQN